MDSKDRKPARPSLFETGPAPPVPQAARVPLEAGLAGPVKPRRWPRTWPWVLAVGLAVAGLVGWMTLSGEPVSASRQVAHASAEAPGDLPAGKTSTAVLVDSGTRANARRASVDDPMSIIRANAEAATGPDDAGAGPQTDLASRFGLGSATPTTERRTSVASSRPATARARASTESSDKADLLAVLMANIREQPQDKPGSTAPQTMDALIAQLAKAPAAEPASNTGGGATASSSGQSSANLQRQLRSCPAANTTAGIRCRQRLCAKHAGDPACPKQ